MMTNDIATIKFDGAQHYVFLSAELNGEREVWRWYTTAETLDEIKAYLAATYPDVSFTFEV